MIDVAVGRRAVPLPWICREIAFMIFMNFFLQIDPNSPICVDDFIRANPRVTRNIAIRIRDAHIRGVVSNRVIGSFQCGVDQSLPKLRCAASELASWEDEGEKRTTQATNLRRVIEWGVELRL